MIAYMEMRPQHPNPKRATSSDGHRGGSPDRQFGAAKPQALRRLHTQPEIPAGQSESRSVVFRLPRLVRISARSTRQCRSDPNAPNLIRVLTHNSSESLVDISVGGPDMLSHELHTVD